MKRLLEFLAVGGLALLTTIPVYSAPFDGFDWPFGNKTDTSGWSCAGNPFKGYCTPGNCGGNSGPYHPGEDWNKSGGDAGEWIYAAGSGTVVASKAINLAGRGDLIIIQHDTPYGTRYSCYLHVTNRLFGVGASVTRGQPIAQIYNMSGSHLHFEMRTSVDVNNLYPHDDGVGYYYSTTAIDQDGFISPTDEINAHRPSSCNADPMNLYVQFGASSDCGSSSDPMGSLLSAISKAGNGGTININNSGSAGGTLNPTGKTVTLRPTGGAVTLGP